MQKPLVIIGAGGFGREVAALAESIYDDEGFTYKVRGMIDDKATGSTVEGFPILGNMEWLLAQKEKPFVACGIGNPGTRSAIINRLEGHGFEFPTLVSPTARKNGRNVSIGEGTIVCENCVLAVNTKIGRHVILNLSCTVGHDTVIEDFASIMPGAMIAGEVHIEKGVYLGIGANVINGVRIGAWSVVGAGGTVTKDIPNHVLAVGVPAKPVKKLAPSA